MELLYHKETDTHGNLLVQVGRIFWLSHACDGKVAYARLALDTRL
jgi:hypothetical protein